MKELNKQAKTPEETEQELSGLAEKLAEIDRAEGVFGEAVTDEELEDVAGGIQLTPSMQPRCAVCGLLYQQNTPPTTCMDPKFEQVCPFNGALRETGR